jgi:hypothetical protein
MSTVHRVSALVDWDTARRLSPFSSEPSSRHLESIFVKLQDALANHLSSVDNKIVYRVQWRIYHGWHSGKTKTADRLIFEKYIAFARPRTIRLVSFSTDFAFGDSLCCRSHRNPIYDTLRRDVQTKEPHQKMVDTILACDLLHLARTRESDMIVLVANDDDFIPVLFTAEMWKARVLMLHTRETMNAHLNSAGLAKKMEFR